MKIRLADVGSIEGVPPGHELVTASLGTDGVVTSMWIASDSPAVQYSRERYPQSPTIGIGYPSLPVSVVVAVTSNEGTEAFTLTDLRMMFPSLCRLPGSGDIVIVAKSLIENDGIAENNAIRVSSGGEVLAEGIVGDAIQHMAVGEDDTIWLGYFDEGVVEGQARVNTPDPSALAGSGIVQFNRDFGVEWRYPQEDELFITDCYTLAVSGSDVYACPYTDFPILRIRNGSVEHWDDIGVPAHYLLVSGSSLAFLGGYRTHWSEGVVVDLESGQAQPLRVVGPRGLDIRRSLQVSVAGDTLMALHGRRILKGVFTVA